MAAGDQGETRDDRPGRRAPWDALARFSLRNLTTALVVALLIAGIAAGLVLLGPERYASQATLVIDNPSEIAAATGPGPIEKFSALRFKYTALVDTAAIARPVAERLRVPLGTVLSDVSASAAGESLVLQISATTDDPQLAQRLAAATSDQLIAYVRQEHQRNGVAQANRFRLERVAAPPLGGKTAPTRSRAIAVAAVAAVVALAAAYVALQLATANRRR
jgi:capsular polysaccharide biosynthesis protein